MENLNPFRQSNFSTACINPKLPSWTRSRRGNSVDWYFLAMDTTRRRLAVTNTSAALSPSRISRRSSRLRTTRAPWGLASSILASRPTSMAWAKRASSLLVNKACLPMSLR